MRRGFSNKPVYRRRRRIALAILLSLFIALISVPVMVLAGPASREVPVATIEPPVFSTAPTMPDGERGGRTAAPDDKTLLLTVPTLGVYGHTVRNDDSAAALDQGAIKLPSTGFPWEKGANTYIAGHRIGYRDTESYYQFYDLPNMKKGDEVILEDSEGRQYVYRVTRIFAVTPQENWVTAPVPGKDMVSLQTCTETVDDWQTISSNLMTSSPDTGRLIVRAERTI